tara:strand:+ start:5137 stop:6534 length:1398 start_codon:yes stop_codon:yes gene_type:complete
MATPNINPRADGEGQFGESAIRWSWFYADNIDGRQIYENGVRVATLVSPTFTGTPLVPTPSASDDSTKIASTAFVQSELADNAFIASLAGAWTSGQIPIAGVAGVANTAGDTPATLVARANHTGTQAQSTIVDLVSDLALLSPIASPTFTGTPAAPTATPATNSTQLATTAYADAAATAVDVSGVATNTANIATNVTNIGTPAGTSNAADIALNTAAIATNVTNIGTNVTDIATNVAAIAALSGLSALSDGYLNVFNIANSATHTPSAGVPIGDLITLGTNCTVNLSLIDQEGFLDIANPNGDGNLAFAGGVTVKDASTGTSLSDGYTLVGEMVKVVSTGVVGSEFYVVDAASLALKAPLASPTLTGIPAAPTAATTTNTTQVATTAFTQQELTAGLAPKAPLASPVFTGVPSLPVYTVATVPAVGSGGGVIFVSDATGGGGLTGSQCFSNGTVWIDTTTGIAVS